MRIRDWSSDVCSSDLDWRRRCSGADARPRLIGGNGQALDRRDPFHDPAVDVRVAAQTGRRARRRLARSAGFRLRARGAVAYAAGHVRWRCPCGSADRSEEHTSELQSLMRISYAVFCLKKKKNTQAHQLESTATTTDSTQQNNNQKR